MVFDRYTVEILKYTRFVYNSDRLSEMLGGKLYPDQKVPLIHKFLLFSEILAK